MAYGEYSKQARASAPSTPNSTVAGNHVNEYRHRDTASLLSDLEGRLWQRCEVAEDLDRDPASWQGGTANLAFLDWNIGLITEELDRRQRLRHRADSPPWPSRPRSLLPDAVAVKAALSIEQYLENRGVPAYRHMRGRLVCLCPLPPHDDASPSFTVYLEQDSFYCFGCGNGGDIFTLHALMTGNADFVATLTELAAEAGLSDRGAA